MLARRYGDHPGWWISPRQYRAGLSSRAEKYSMSSTASPARMTARSAAATNDRPAGKARSSAV